MLFVFSSMAKEYKMHETLIEDVTLLESDAIYSYADYLMWSFEERVELIKGKVFRMSPAPLMRHQLVSSNLLREIMPFLKNKPCKVFHAPFDVRLPVKKGDQDSEIYSVVQPDICIVCDPKKLDEKGCSGPPDLIIEILSQSTASRDLKNKFELYEESGVAEYWIVFPNDRVLEIYLQDSSGKFYSAARLTENDTVPCGLLSGIAMVVGELFE